MKAADIKPGRVYHARISGKVVVVKVNNIHHIPESSTGDQAKTQTEYHVTNLFTGSSLVLHNAGQFIDPANIPR
jgi:hypothetical protein